MASFSSLKSKGEERCDHLETRMHCEDNRQERPKPDLHRPVERHNAMPGIADIHNTGTAFSVDG